MSDDPLVLALEDVSATAARRNCPEVYQYAMAAAGLLLTDAIRHRPMAEAVLDSSRAYLARRAQ